MTPEFCITCGRRVGDIGRDGNKLRRMPIVEGSKHVDLLHWCSGECYVEWLKKCKEEREKQKS